MARIALLLAGWLVAAGAASAANNNPTFGMHGMALFGGKDGLYASHLPMFHAPHDYQVVFRLRLQDPALDKALRARMDGNTALWTIAPENFELDRLAPQATRPLTRFKGDVVLGHFEQGGKAQWVGATVVVEKVLLFRQLSADYKQNAAAHYLQVGSGSSRYLVKEVDSRPDFDHIVAVQAASRTPALPVLIAKKGLGQPPGAALEKALPGAKVRGTVYYFTDDLK
jgi:hypothetical protein